MTAPTPEPVEQTISDTAPPGDAERDELGRFTSAPEPDDVELPRDLEAAKKLRSEAANLRRENRELRADNERLITQAGARQRADIEAAAAEVLVDGADVWRVDPNLQQSFYDEQFGEISTDGVVAAAKKLASEKPHLARPPSAPPPSDRPIEGLRGGASPEPRQTEVTWNSALRGTGI